MPRPDVLLISPLFPPAHGGLADHTRWLAENLAARHEVQILTKPGGAADFARQLIPFKHWQSRADLLQAIDQSDASTLIWQYVPHMYGRGGVNFSAPGVIRAAASKRRQIILAHEIAAPYSVWPQRAFYAWAQRRQWRVIAQHANSIGISTEAWLGRWAAKPAAMAGKSFLMPSPSNIPVEPVPENHRSAWRRASQWPDETRVILYFGSISTPKQFPWVQAAWRAARAHGPAALVVIGGDIRFAATDEERRFLQIHPFLPAAEVSLAMQAADVLALPFIDGASERRGSLMAGLSHGLPVITTIGPATGPTLRKSDAFAAVPRDREDLFTSKVVELLGDPAHREGLSQRARAAYDRAYSWARAIERLEPLLSGK